MFDLFDSLVAIAAAIDLPVAHAMMDVIIDRAASRRSRATAVRGTVLMARRRNECERS